MPDATGVFDRLENVVAPDLEGLTSPLTVFLNNNLVLAYVGEHVLGMPRSY